MTQPENLISLSKLSPLLQEALSYWEKIKLDRTMPKRKDIDPLEIPKVLEKLMIMEVIRDEMGIDFKYSLIGSFIVDISGPQRKNKRMSELPHQNKESSIFKTCEYSAKNATPFAVRTSYTGDSSGFSGIISLFLPLSNDEENIHDILVVIEPIKK